MLCSDESGALVFIPIYTIHRHRSLWSNPDAFDPGRFTVASERARPRCAFMPFGAGPRVCIGASFAMLEMVVGLAMLLKATRLRFSDASPPQPIHRITLPPRGPLTLCIDART
jgi:cytochrome P450